MVDLGPGSKLGRFVIEKQIGKGASGVVYLAKDTLLSQPVALKVLHPWLVDDAEVRERFKREIVLTRRIANTGVCRLHDLHEEDDHTFITMEYVEGQTLAALIHKEGRQAPARVLGILRGLVPALSAAHAVGVVHRDLKPGNIMVKPDGSVCVLDFGMATAQDVTKITQAGRTVGSLRFIAPEVWQGEPATPLSDIYAIGVVLFACMAGRLPYEASTPAEAFKAQKQGPPSLVEHNTAVTPGVDAVVRQAMARRPQDRFPDVDALLSAFEKAVSGEEATSSTGTVIVRPRDAQDPSNIRLAQLKEPEGDDVFAATPVAVPKPVLIGAAVVGAVIVAAVIAAIAAGPAPKPDAGVVADRSGDAAARAGAAHDDDGGDDTAEPPLAAVGGSTDAGPAGATRAPSSPQAPERAPARTGSGGMSGGAGGSKALYAAMKRRGILAGDEPKVDAYVAKVRKLEAAGRSTSDAVERGKDAVEKTVIDRGFITAKQKRLSFVIDRVAPANQKKVYALQSEAEKKVATRDYAGANEALNRAFSLVGR